jgi:acyl carrier protein
MEREFAFTVTDDDLDIRNFNSIEAISTFIGRKLAATVEA